MAELTAAGLTRVATADWPRSAHYAAVFRKERVARRTRGPGREPRLGETCRIALEDAHERWKHGRRCRASLTRARSRRRTARSSSGRSVRRFWTGRRVPGTVPSPEHDPRQLGTKLFHPDTKTPGQHLRRLELGKARLEEVLRRRCTQAGRAGGSGAVDPHVRLQESSREDLLNAWAEGDYTWRELARAVNAAGEHDVDTLRGHQHADSVTNVQILTRRARRSSYRSPLVPCSGRRAPRWKRTCPRTSAVCGRLRARWRDDSGGAVEASPEQRHRRAVPSGH